MLALVLAFAFLPGEAGAESQAATAPPPPPSGGAGAYRPAPEAPNEKHAADFVNELLEQRGGKKRVTVPELRGGVTLPQTDAREGGAPGPPPSLAPPAPPADVKDDAQLPRPDQGPAERAGVASPVDQDVPGVLLGLVVAVILAAVGVVLEVSDRRRRKA